jgi:hypothetical protein
LVPPCGTGSGIGAPAFKRAGATEQIPPGPTPFSITPTAAGTVDFTIDYEELALELRNLALSTGGGLAEVCVGGACPLNGIAGDICMLIMRGTLQSPRIMYDANCDKVEAAADECVPFKDFADIAEICNDDGTDTFPNVPSCCDPDINGAFSDVTCIDPANVASCCAGLAADYPTATPTQQPRLIVNQAP